MLTSALCLVLVTTVAMVSSSVPAQKQCDAPIDLLFLVDKSASIRPHQYVIEKKFVGEMIKRFKVASDAVRISMALFAIGVHNQFHFNKYSNAADIEAYVSTMECPKCLKGRTGTGAGLKFGATESFKAENGARAGVLKVVVVLTDGRSTEAPAFLKAQVELMHSTGAQVITVGVGLIKYSELQMIATDDKNVFSTDDFSKLMPMLDDISQKTCDVALPGPDESCEKITTCKANLVCSGGKCSCPADTYWEGEECSAFPGPGEDCIASGGKCFSNLLCVDDFCECKDGEHFYDGQCSAIPGVDESCKASGGKCSSNLQCLSDVCSCSEGDYFDEDGGKCLPVPGPGGPCSSKCASNLVCNGVCECPVTHEWNGAECVPLPGPGQPCTSKCSSNLVCSGTCGCESDQYYSELDDQCGPLPGPGESCDLSQGKCGEGLTCADDICSCPSGQIFSDEGKCIPKPPEPPVCRTLVDLLFLVDKSASIKKEHFKIAKKFIAQVVDRMDISDDNVHVSVGLFANKAHNVFCFNKYSNKEDVLGAVRGLSCPKCKKGKTGTGDALRMGRKFSLTPKCGVRKGVKKLVVVLTDGKSTEKQWFLKKQAREMRRSGAKVITIGVGKKVDKKELRLIASSRKLAFRSKAFENLLGMLDSIVAQTCRAAKGLILD